MIVAYVASINHYYCWLYIYMKFTQLVCKAHYITIGL